MNQLTKDLFLTDSELEQLLKALESATDRDALVFRVLIETGCRVSEALNLTAADLDAQASTVYIRGLKSSNDRVIPVSSALINSLVEIQSTGKLFKVSTQWLRRVLKQRFKISKKIHSLRHTMAVNLYKHTKDIHLVKQALGHRNINNTMIYLNFVQGEEQLKVMREMYQGKTNKQKG